MLSDEEKQRIGEDLLSGAIGSALEMAATADDLEENDAVMTVTAAILSEKPPIWLLATATAALAVRMRRTQQLEATLNNRERDR